MHVVERQRLQLVGAARILAFLTLGAPVLWAHERGGLTVFLALGAVWLAAQAGLEAGHQRSVLLVEPVLVGALCAYSLDTATALLAALALPPMVAGLLRGLLGVAWSLTLEVGGLVSVAVLLHSEMSADLALSTFTWAMAGLGLGLIATFVHSTARDAAPPSPLAPYLYAQSLLRQLIDISGGLSSGLEPTVLGGAVLSAVRDELPFAHLELRVPRGETLTPLATKTLGEGAEVEACADLAAEAYAVRQTLVRGRLCAVPLTSEGAVIGVMAGSLPDSLRDGLGDDLAVAERLEALVHQLGSSLVQLDTALLFAAFRDAATADERRRLSREMHDGVAQEIASLGYLVDALVAKAEDDKQAERLTMLRQRITAVVAEVRRSVQTLRTSVGTNESLGAAIGTVVRHLRDSSGIAIEVVLDEGPARLRPEVEAELFRITQEALNNAVKHSGAELIRVECRVHAPTASISVIDNGKGLGTGRTDSYGLGIMRERAALVDADLDVAEPPSGGLRVTVRVGRTRTASAGGKDGSTVRHGGATIGSATDPEGGGGSSGAFGTPPSRTTQEATSP